MKQEAFVALVQNIVNNLFVKLSAKCYCCKRLGLATCEYSRSVRSRNIVGFNPYRTYIRCLATVQTNTFVKYATAHSFAFNIVIVTFYQRCLFVAFFFRKAFNILVANSVERVLAPVLVGTPGFRHCISLVIAFFTNVGTQVLVVCLMTIFTFNRTYGLGKFHLGLALHLDGFVSGFQCSKKVCFRHFFHFALNHHYIFISSADHQFHVVFLYLFKRGVDHELSVNTCHTHFRNRAVERNVADSKCCRCSQSGKCVGSIITVGREHYNIYKCICMIIVRKQRTKYTVNQTGCQYFVVRCTAFAFKETAGETAVGREFLFIFHLQGHKVYPFASLFCRDHRG